MYFTRVASFIFLFLFSILRCLSQPGSGNFILKIRINGVNGQPIFFSYRGLGNERIWDSAIVRQGSVVFKGFITHPAKALITILKTNRTSTVDPNVTTPLFLEATSMQIKLSFNRFRNAKLTGSRTQNEFMELENLKRPVNKELIPLVLLRNQLDEKFSLVSEKGGDTLSGIIRRLNVINSRIDLLNKKLLKADKGFFNKHPGSYITAYKIVDDIRHYSLTELEHYYSRMPASIRQSDYGMELAADIQKMSKGSPGTVAGNFSATELNGATIRLSDYSGKYVLLDFWASWCKPCRAGNPELIDLYIQYKNQGFEILGIASDDKTVNKWKEAIATDGIGIWKQVLEGEIGALYHIQGYPTKILIDRSGKIIARYSQDDGEANDLLPGRLKRIFGKGSR